MVIDIVAVARETGVPASTLRYYEEQRLITSVGRRGLRRLFESSVVERLRLIALGRIAGFSLEELSLMLGTEGRPKIDRKALAKKADELDATIAKLTKLRDGLRHAVNCKAPSHLECPSFQRLLGAVAEGRIRAEPTTRAPTPRLGRRR